MRRFVAIALLAASCHSVHAHGFAGNRFLPGTLTMDDSAVCRRGNFARLFEFETSGGKRTAFSTTGYKLLGDQLHQQQELILRKRSPG